ncbi:MAG TPA: phosphomannomutase/phosphoglucomutase [Gemmatimonadaceae bacterium]|nr:phosphomannomutase/phosphoglucomutase [Gemmatimonadaceae bacterium]
MNLVRDIFREYDIRGITGKELTPDVARVVGRAFAAFLDERGIRGSVAVGRDNRPSGDGLHDALVAGLTESGVNVIDIGVVPTPVAYWAQHNLDVVAGIQITGSHNPPEYNGFKLGVEKASIYGDDIQRIYQLASAGAFPSGAGNKRDEAVIDRYIDDIVNRIGRISRPLRVAVDAGNGVGGLVAPTLLAKLGVDVTCMFCDSDGTFPNHHADPTVPENLEALINEMYKGGYDFGVAFDGDADRIGVVQQNGDIIWGDYLLLLYARDVLTRVRNAPIIFDVKCSQALPEAIEKAGGVPVMWKTGHSLIEEKMHELHAPLAGEMSGHMYFSEGWYGFDDALYGAARLLKIVADSGSSIHELLADVPRFVSTPEIRVNCPDDRKFGVVSDAVKYFSARYSTNDVDGVRIQYPDGWGLIRASNTQPVIVLRFEARTRDQLDAIRDEIEGWLTQHGVQI